MDTTVKREPADVDNQLDEDDVCSVKQELDIGPEVLQSPDLQYMVLHCKPELAGDASPIEPDHLIKNEPNSALAQDSSGAVRIPGRGQYISCSEYICDICSRSFDFKTTLQRHLLTHTVERPHKCNICEKNFSRKFNMIRHLLIHTGERPHKCDTCRKVFTRKSGLDGHMFSHTGERPHMCDICKQGFSHLSALKKHILTHTGEQPYKCNICEKKFSRKFLRNSHMLIHMRE